MLMSSITFVLLLYSQQILAKEGSESGFDGKLEGEGDGEPGGHKSGDRPNTVAECEAQGYCHQGKCLLIKRVVECNCIKPYVDDMDGTRCSYEGKSKLIAFLLSLFVGGFGADWFYLADGDGGYVFAGIVKLGLQLFLPLLCFCCSQACGDSMKVVGGCCSVLMPVAGGIWWLADWIRIVNGSWSTDGSGHSIFPDL